MTHADPYFYHAEATMPPGMACYIERASDAALLKALREGQYAIMLSSRKVGKSSLMEHAFVRLREEGIYVVKKELTEAGDTVTAEGWYAGLVQELVNDAMLRNQFEVQADWREWWRAHADIPPGQRFVDFVRRYFLAPTEVAWVIAIDEIDTTIPLGFSDDFFAAVRSCQNKRAADPMFARLTFLLAGVASPAQLIKDNRRTPFNIGHAVGLSDFTADEAKVLLRGLGLPEEADHPLLQRVLYWTGGHPYLTHRLFRQLAEGLEQADKAVPDWESLVDTAVKSAFLHASARTTESHFHDIARRRIGGLRGMAKRRILGIYQRALRKKVVKDDALSQSIVELKLCGLLVCDPQDASKLVLRNRIYGGVFDAAWVKEEMPRNFVDAAIISAAIFFSVGLLLAYENITVANLSAQIEQADTDVPMPAYAKLRNRWWRVEQADKLMGQYWVRQARAASVARPRDEAALLWLKALTIDASPEASLQARNAFAGSLAQVTGTLRHHDKVVDVTFNADGRRVLTASWDGTARLWDSSNGTALGNPMTHDNWVNNAIFSPDGRQVLTGSLDNTARLWSAANGAALGKVFQHKGPVTDAVFSSDGQQVLTGSRDNTAQLWETKTGLALGQAMQHHAAVLSIGFSLDGQRLLTAAEDGSAQLWHAASSKPLGQIMQHQAAVQHAVFSTDGLRISTSSYDATTRLWDGKTSAYYQTMRHQDWVMWSAFSPDGRQIATASRDGSARLWHSANGQAIGQAMQHQNPVRHTCFNRSGNVLFTGSYDNSARLWDVATSQPLGLAMQHQDTVYRVAFSPDGQHFATASGDGTARLWVAGNWHTLGKPIPGSGLVRFSPDGQRLLALQDGKILRMWDVGNGHALAPIQYGEEIRDVFFSPDGRRLLVVAKDNTARLWDIQNGQPLGQAIKQQGEIYFVSFSPNGRRIVTIGDGMAVRFWDGMAGQEIVQTIGKAIFKPYGDKPNPEYVITHATFSADGQRLLLASDGVGVRVWDIETAKPLPDLMVTPYFVEMIALSPDSKRLVTGDANFLRVWDTASGKQNGPAIPHQNVLTFLAFSTDGQRLVTATEQTLTWFSVTATGQLQAEKTQWANAGHWASKPVILDPAGTTVRIADAWTGDQLLLRDISVNHIGEPGLPELPGKPAQMLADYQKRFALRFENEQKSPKIVTVLPGDAVAESDKTPVPK